jgi:2-(1,2-epoxy-1,2-dihydrophenyl)acetyl-CoA isomerase
MAYERILLSVDDSIARITINRPKQFNAIDVQTAVELLEAATRCEENDVRAVVITGAGEKAFCAGGDVVAFAAQQDRVGDLIDEMTKYLHTALAKFAHMRAPVIAAVNGVAAGAGLGLVAAADYAIAVESARFASAYTKIGLTPDGSSTYFLPRIIGRRRALELFLTNRSLTADEAVDWGLVNRTVSADQLANEVTALASTLASGPTQSYGSVKDLLLRSPDQTLEAQMQSESLSIVAASRRADGIEGVRAFANKAEARFTGN